MHDVETERRNRIRVAVFAFAYEVMCESLVSDADFDELCRKIRPQMSTGHPVMDKFFAEVFSPCTGMWISRHPHIQGIRSVYKRAWGRTSER